MVPEEKSNGNGKPEPGLEHFYPPGLRGAMPGTVPELTGTKIIHAYFVGHLKPEFRRGHAVVCKDGMEYTQMTACVPDSEVLELLAKASDAPRELPKYGGCVKLDTLPSFFTKWSKVAWGDLLKGLPEEWDAELGADSKAAEEFRRLVGDTMLSEVTLGDTIKGTDVTQREHASLIDWCKKFADLGPWRSIRSKKCWCKLLPLPTGDGEVGLAVAIAHGLFGQMKSDRRLIAMGANRFGRLAARYGVGTSTRSDRPHGQSAVVLDSAFLENLVGDVIRIAPADLDQINSGQETAATL